MNSKRYQLLFMSVMGIVWSVYELGIRIVSYFKVLNSETININAWISYTLLESVLFILLYGKYNGNLSVHGNKLFCNFDIRKCTL